MSRFSLALLCLFVCTIVPAADLIRLRPDFSRNDWPELLIPSENPAPSIRDRQLELPPGSAVRTPRLPLTEGTLRVRGNASGQLDVCLGFFRGTHEIKTIPVRCRGGAFAETLLPARLPGDCDRFELRIANTSVKALRLDFLELSLAVEGALLTGDPLFQNALGRDHWIVRRGGRDWDNLPYSGNGKGIRLISSGGPGGGGLLELNGAGTVTTPVFPYNGEKILIGAWLRQQNLVKGKDKPGWAYATIQIVQFDRNGKEIGHRDLSPLEPGDKPWQFHLMTLEPGKVSRQTESFAIYIRVFDGASGTFQVGMTCAIRQGSAVRRAPYDETRGTMKIDARRPANEFPPIWQAADMSYASDICHREMRYALARIRESGVRHLRLRGCMQGLKIVKSLTPDGKFQLDFTLADQLLDYVVRDLKYDLTFTVEPTPDQLSVKPTGKPDAFTNIHPPRDRRIWGEILKEIVKHWLARYGRETVERWSFECWNEPNASAFFGGTDTEFTEIFGTYLETLTAIEQEEKIDLDIGTMSAAGPTPWFFNIFEKARTLGKLDKIDFISFHLYGGFVNSMDAFPGGIALMRKIAAQNPPMDRRPLRLTEYNANTMSDTKLDQATAAAFNVRAVKCFLDNGIERAYFFSVCDFLWAWDNKHFKGGLGLFTSTGIPKPVFNSVILLNRLTDCRRLQVESSNEPFDALAGITPEEDAIRILITSFDERQPAAASPAKLRLEVKLPKPYRKIEISATRVDSSRANSFAEFVRQGKPTDKRQPDVSGFRKANELKAEPITAFRLESGRLTLELEMELNALCFLEITPADK